MSFDLQGNLNGVSRRSFLRTLGAASAAAAALPAAFGQQTVAPVTATGPGTRRGMSDMGEMRQLPPNAVIISSNENPLGPAPSALSAICTTASMGGRYHNEETMKTLAVFNEQFGLKRGYSALFPGSGGPLDLALMSNIGPDKPLVYGDPSYEQGFRAAEPQKFIARHCGTDRLHDEHAALGKRKLGLCKVTEAILEIGLDGIAVRAAIAVGSRWDGALLGRQWAQRAQIDGRPISPGIDEEHIGNQLCPARQIEVIRHAVERGVNRVNIARYRVAKVERELVAHVVQRRIECELVV